jgi:sarcosine oxidase/L-pipecolate oxidase
MSSDHIYDVVVVGGGPVGLASAYQVAKEGRSVVVLEQRNFFNQAGSSGDMARMFRTM